MQTSTISPRPRRKRQWAPQLSDVAQLSRSARQLARNSASRIAQPSVAKCLAEYRQVLVMEFLVNKHTRPGDLVFDACGCTGVMSVAAINCGRRWVYAESHAENYRIGAARIATRLAEVTPAAS